MRRQTATTARWRSLTSGCQRRLIIWISSKTMIDSSRLLPPSHQSGQPAEPAMTMIDSSLSLPPSHQPGQPAEPAKEWGEGGMVDPGRGACCAK